MNLLPRYIRVLSGCARRLAGVFSVDALGEVIEGSRAAHGQLAAYELSGLGLSEIGRG